MPNITDIRIVQEGWRNAIVRVTGDLSVGDVTFNPLITLAQFNNNDPIAGKLVGLRIDFIEWSMSTGLEIMIQWNSNSPQSIFPISGRGRTGAKNFGGLLPDQTISGYNGSINLYTIGASGGTFVTGQHANFSVTLEMVKLYK